MIKGWIIYSKQTLSNKFNNNAFEWMISEAQKNGLDAKIIFEEDIEIEINNSIITFKENNINVDKPDFVLLRSYCIDIAIALEKQNVPVFNTSDSLNSCRNKWVSHLICSQNNIPSPKTIFAKKESINFSNISKTLGVPFVLKEVFGSKGEQVYLIENENNFYATINNTQSQIICQEYIEESKGRDLRVHVIGNNAVVGIERIANQGFKSNYSLGGSSREFILNDKLKELAIKTSKAHKLDIAGIDILFSNKGPLVCEVNGISAFRTVALNTDINLPNLIFKHIKEKLTATNTVYS